MVIAKIEIYTGVNETAHALLGVVEEAVEVAQGAPLEFPPADASQELSKDPPREPIDSPNSARLLEQDPTSNLN